MNGKKLSLLQTKELRLLKVFINLCKENDPTYFVCDGSFLGFVRHKGGIPWADVIDVAMVRPDFEWFLEIAPRLLFESTYVNTYKKGRELISGLFSAFHLHTIPLKGSVLDG